MPQNLRDMGMPKLAAIWQRDFEKTFVREFYAQRVQWFDNNSHDEKYKREFFSAFEAHENH